MSWSSTGSLEKQWKVVGGIAVVRLLIEPSNATDAAVFIFFEIVVLNADVDWCCVGAFIAATYFACQLTRGLE